jgi:hypothetical protein
MEYGMGDQRRRELVMADFDGLLMQWLLDPSRLPSARSSPKSFGALPVRGPQRASQARCRPRRRLNVRGRSPGSGLRGGEEFFLRVAREGG